jgi:hypothetical protein
MSLFCANLINAWTIFYIGKKQERKMKRFTSQKSSKFNLANIIDGLFSAILANNGIYIAITLFDRLIMLL